MQTFTHSFIARQTGLLALLVVIVSGLLVQHVKAGTLNVDVQSPPLPATELDVIILSAVTSDFLLPSPAWQTVTTSIEINGFDIDWKLISNDTGLIGAAIPLSAGANENIGPLPAGTYNVTATWTRYNFVAVGVPENLELLLALSTPIFGPLTGATQFTVVPEPAALSVLIAALCPLALRRRV